MAKKHYIFLIWCIALMLGSCSNEPSSDLTLGNDDDHSNDSDYIAVTLGAPGNYGAPLSDLNSSRSNENYDDDLEGHSPTTLEEGSTLWIYYAQIEVEKNADGTVKRDGNGDFTITNNAETNYKLRSFVVKKSEKFDDRPVLYSCDVDEEGTVLYLSSHPIYLDRHGVYIFRCMGPARKLTSSNGLYINNGDYVYSTDDRYEKTSYTVVDVEKEIEEVENKTAQGFDPTEIVIDLHPMIYQVAQLKFTLTSEEITVKDKDGNPELNENGEQVVYYPVHSLEVTNSGVVITGLQDHYDKETQGSETWNWTLTDNYIKTYPGDVYTYYTLYTPKTLSDHEVVFETAILPVDAVANPIIVEFYLRINGVPTQLQMMLNRKMFLHAYSYHYKGTIKLTNGITVLEWQEVTGSQEEEIFIQPTNPDDRTKQSDNE